MEMSILSMWRRLRHCHNAIHLLAINFVFLLKYKSIVVYTRLDPLLVPDRLLGHFRFLPPHLRLRLPHHPRHHLHRLPRNHRLPHPPDLHLKQFFNTTSHNLNVPCNEITKIMIHCPTKCSPLECFWSVLLDLWTLILNPAIKIPHHVKFLRKTGLRSKKKRGFCHI